MTICTVSFTASRDVPDGAVEAIIGPAILGSLPTAPGQVRFVVGACRGGDTEIAAWLLRQVPLSPLLVVVPANRSQVVPWYELEEFEPQKHAGLLEVEYMPPGTTYEDRNGRLVQVLTHPLDRLLGFPAYSEYDRRSRGSGSWQTIRIARQARKPVRWWSLDGCEFGR